MLLGLPLLLGFAAPAAAQSTVSFSQANYHIQEGKGPLQVQLKLSAAHTSATNVNISATPLTATGNGVDYSHQTFTATFPAGTTTATISIPITADNLREPGNSDGAETFRLDIHNFNLPTDVSVGNPNLAYVNIYDAPFVKFERPDTTTLSEGGLPIEFELDVSEPYFTPRFTGGPLSHGLVHVQHSGGAGSGIDYELEYWYEGIGWLSGEARIAAFTGEAATRVRIRALTDNKKESTETATISLIDLPQVYKDLDQPFYRVSNPRTLTFTIVDQTTNNAPTVANAIPDQSAAVGTAFSYAFPANTFNDADGDSLTYRATKSDNNALPSWLSFNAGTRTFSGTPQSGDTGTVSVKVTADDGYSGSVSDTFDMVVSAANTPAVDFASGSSSAAESAGTHNVRVNLSSPAPSGGLTLRYSVSGTATAGSGNDFTIQNSGTLSVSAGATTATIPVVINDDSTDDDNETVILILAGGTGYTVGSPSVHTLTITDNDDPQPGTPVITIAGGNAVTEGTGASFTLTASPVPTTNLNVNLEVEDSADFVVTIHEGTKMVTIGTSGTATYTVPTDNDNTDESNGSVKVTVKTGTGYTVGSTDSAKVTVNDDDPAPGTPALDISRNTLSVSEGGTGSYTVRLATEPTGTVTVNIASNNPDVTVDPAPLTFHASGGSKLWNTAQTVTVSVAQDNDDANDSATLTHSATGSDYGSVSSSVTVTVNDDDRTRPTPTPPPTTPNPGTGTGGGGVSASAPVISVSGEGVAEEGEVLLYRIISEEPVEQDTEVKIKVEQRGEYTEPAESTVTIKEGEKEAVYEVTTTDDSIDEEDGEVTVTVLSGTGYNIGTNSSVTLEVRDNDNAGIKVSEAKLSVSGEGGRVSYTVVLTSEPVLEVRVEPYSQNSSVVVVSGALVFTKENWDREQTVTVRGNESGSTVIGHRISSEDNVYSSVNTENVEVRVEDKKKEEGAGEWTGRFGRTVAERVVEAVSRRMEGERESRVEIAGVHPVEKRPESIWGEQEQESISLEEVLLASSLEVGREGSAVFWANASRSSFEGRREGWSGDGNVTMGVGGADWNTESMVGGLMIIRADGSGDYGGSSIDAHITGVAPYAGGKITDYMSVWGTVGVGRGEIRVEEGNERWSSDIGWKMAAGGIRGDIVTRKTEGLGLAFVSDVLYAKSDSEDYFEEGVSRIRAGVEGTWTARLSESALFEPRLEAGLRRDGGDAERGMGAELGGGVKLRHTELGITVDIEGRGLVSHEDGGFESRGISASFEWEKDMSEGRGASVALRQDWGEPESGGMESLFYDGPIRGGEVSSNGSRLSAEAEYGFMREGMRQAPYVDYGRWEEGRDYALGWRVSTISSDVSVDVNATRRESEQTDTEHGVGVRLDVRW